jgi:hypothetical protein
MKRRVLRGPNPYSLPIALFVIGVLAVSAYAADPNVARIGAFDRPGATADIKQAIEDKGYRIVVDDGWTAEFWFARTLGAETKGSPGALYPELSNGEFIAIVNFPKGTTDYRGQAIPAGAYSLRYQYLPQDANHMGVSPNPDFLLAIPLAADPKPAEVVSSKELVSLSTKTTGTTHPAVIAMAPAGDPASVVKDDQGMTVLTVNLGSGGARKSEKIGIVLKGQATQ